MCQRVEFIDIARGIAIILVALYHSRIKMYFPELVYSMSLFRMPAFFFISGVFFVSTGAASADFIIKKADALLKPYVVTSLLVLLFVTLFGSGEFSSQFWGILYGNGHTIIWVPLWFLPHLFAVFIFTNFVFLSTKIDSKDTILKGILLGVLLTIGVLLLDVYWHMNVVVAGIDFRGPGLPFSIDLIFITSFFFILGAFSKEYVIQFRPSFPFAIIALIMLVSIRVFTDAHLDLHIRQYTNPLATTIGALCGIYLVLSAAFYIAKIDPVKRAFIVFGQASLFLLLFHDPVAAYVYELFVWLGMGKEELWLAVVAFLISITAPLAIRLFVIRNRWLSSLFLPIVGR